MRFYCALSILFIFLLAGCDLVQDRIGDQLPPTATPQAFNTATPGGRISVWMIAPTGEVVAASTPAPGSEGIVVGPAATATAAMDRIIAATQTAAAPTPQPVFQTGDCPTPSGLSAPTRPASFVEFPAIIGVYLSNGGAPSVLESTLRGWGAITDRGGMVQADTDVTGDKVPEIIIAIYNPFTYNGDAVLNAGRLIVYGCDNGGYRLLHNSPDNAALALPVFHRIGDMNGDTKAEIVYDVQSCSLASCTREGYILTWNPVVGIFEALNSGQILAVNGRLGIADLDADGILELTATNTAPTTTSSGPTRGVIDVWDWSGINYVLAQRLPQESQYRIHILHDADGELLVGNTQEAIRLYQLARDEDTLLAWSLPNETAILRAYTLYRLTIANARRGNNQRAEQALTTLNNENPEGSAGAGYAVIGRAFMDTFRTGAGITAACQAAIGAASTRPETLSYLNSYGSANRTYQPGDLCPF